MPNKEQKSYTLMLVPDGGDRVQRLRVTPRRLRVFAYSAFFFVVFAFVAGGYSLYNIASLPDRWHMEEQLLLQRLHLEKLSTKMQALEEDVDRVNRLDRKLRIVLGQSTPTDDGQTLGIGGPNPDEFAKLKQVLDSKSSFKFAQLDVQTDELRQRSRLQENHLYDLEALLIGQASRLASTPSIWPTRGWVTSNFGMRTSPFTGARKMHEGMDIATRHGKPVVSPAEGVVLFAGVKSSYGNLIIIDHGYGLATRYGHLARIDVSPGQRLARGDQIGTVGNTGRSTGPHLHYEVHLAGVPVNPYRYILLDDKS